MRLLLYANHCCLHGWEMFITLYRLVFLHPIYCCDTLGSASQRLLRVTIESILIFIYSQYFPWDSSGLMRGRSVLNQLEGLNTSTVRCLQVPKDSWEMTDWNQTCVLTRKQIPTLEAASSWLMRRQRALHLLTQEERVV